MLSSGNGLLVRQLVTTIPYKLLRLIFITLQYVYWQLNGTARKLREARLPQNYERSAHVLDVIFCYKFCPMMMTSVSDFLLTHNRFENPQYIIDNDNITLLTINEHEAVFCEAKEKGMHLWRLKYGGFMHHAQNNFCRCLIIVPLTTFHRLAETIGDPKGELIFLFHIPRSGSTLLTQVMEYTERCVAVSEPLSPLIVAMKYRKFGDSPEMRQLARDVIRWECRPYPTMHPPPLAYCLKLMTISIVALPVLRELFPSSRCLFIYRDFETVVKSSSRSEQVVPTVLVLSKIARVSTWLTKVMLDAIGLNGADFCEFASTGFMVGAIVPVITTSSYLDARRRGLDIRAVRFEDFVARPLDMCRVVLEYCHLPVSLAELAVRGFETDSQRNSILAKSVVGHLKEAEITVQTKAKLNELLKKYEMPLIGEPQIIEGTLTCR